VAGATRLELATSGVTGQFRPECKQSLVEKPSRFQALEEPVNPLPTPANPQVCDQNVIKKRVQQTLITGCPSLTLVQFNPEFHVGFARVLPNFCI
jgi:hypothetical protein